MSNIEMPRHLSTPACPQFSAYLYLDIIVKMKYEEEHYYYLAEFTHHKKRYLSTLRKNIFLAYSLEDAPPPSQKEKGPRKTVKEIEESLPLLNKKIGLLVDMGMKLKIKIRELLKEASDTMRTIFYDLADKNDLVFDISFKIMKQDINPTTRKNHYNAQIMFIRLSDVALACLRYIPDTLVSSGTKKYCDVFGEIESQTEKYLLRKTKMHCYTFLLPEKKDFYFQKIIISVDYLRTRSRIQNAVIACVIHHPRSEHFLLSINVINQQGIRALKKQHSLILLKRKQKKLREAWIMLQNRHEELARKLNLKNGIVEASPLFLNDRHIFLEYNLELQNALAKKIQDSYRQLSCWKKELAHHEKMISSYPSEKIIAFLYYPLSFLYEIKNRALDDTFYLLHGPNEFVLFNPINKETFLHLKKTYALKKEIEKKIIELKYKAYLLLTEEHYPDYSTVGSALLQNLYWHMTKTHVNPKKSVEVIQLESLKQWLEIEPFSFSWNKALLEKCIALIEKYLP